MAARRRTAVYYDVECPVCGRIFSGMTEDAAKFRMEIHRRTAHKGS